MKGIIYYTDNALDKKIDQVVKAQLLSVGLPIVSSSLEPIDFGWNIVLRGHKRGYVTMVKQILAVLQESREKYVFFCEHDVLYPESHFDFTPPRDDIFYYNENVLRWEFGSDHAVSYDRMLPLSCLCVNRKFALSHYKLRLSEIEKAGESEFKSHEPHLARKWGYEPGTKKKKRGGLTDDDFDTWRSEYPVIDIRHKNAFSPPKVTLESFKHAPVNWKEIPANEVPGWNLRGIFNL